MPEENKNEASIRDKEKEERVAAVRAEHWKAEERKLI